MHAASSGETDSAWSLLEAAPDAMLVVGASGRIEFLNAQTERMFGYTRAELLQEPLEKLLPQRFREQHALHVARFLATPRARPMGQGLELHGRHADGREFPVEIALSPVQAQVAGRPLVIAAIRDTSARKHIEEELRRSEERFRGLLDNLPDFVLTLDADGTICFANRDRPPLTRAGLVGQSWLALASPDHHERMRAALRRVLETGQPGTYEVTSLAPDGTVRWSAHHIGPLRHGDGVVSAVVIARDVTEKRRLEAQLVATDRMASMGMLAAGVAHEINNPLAVIVANLELASGELNLLLEQQRVPEILREELQDAAEAAARVRNIVRDLRIFSRAESEQLTPIDVREVLESTLRMAWNEIRHRARLVRDYRDVPAVQANEGRLGQVFLNLILNAAQAIREGRADANEIRVSTHGDARGEVWIEIGDTGSGMAPDVQRRVFDPFFTTKPAGVGSGLGLAICTRIVSGLGGSIELESQPGKGSLFRVRLPAFSGAPGAPGLSSPQPGPGAPARRGRVLVIDDEDLMGSAIRRALEPGHDVVVVRRAGDALERLGAGARFDVILCDIMMPELSGVDFYRALRQRAPLAAERVVFVTGGVFSSEAREFLERSPQARLDKPFDVAALRALVNQRIDHAPD